MPHISMRISASSSTTRMSCAMCGGPCCDGGRSGVGLCDGARLDAMEDEHDARAAAFAVLERKLAAVILHDLLDDGEAEPGTLGARRHVRLGEPLAPLARQAAAAILDDERGLPGRLGDAHGDL